jgi:ribose transport system substrate-binding protein
MSAVSIIGCAQTGSSGEPSSAASDINVEQAKADLEAVIDASPVIDVPAIDGTIPEGQAIDVISCVLPICQDVATGVKQAADVLGWQVNDIPNDLTPTGYQAAWDQIAQNPGNAIVNTAPILPYSAVSSQVEAAGAPIVSVTSADPVGDDVITVLSSEDDVALQSATQANWVIQDAGAPVKSVFVYDPSVVAIRSALTGYQDALAKNCAACTVDVLEVSAAQIGPALAQQVISYLQSNPDTKYVSFGLGDLATGVPAAIETSGLRDQVKLTTRAATPTNLIDVQNGDMDVAFTTELFEAGWRSVDAIIRSLTGTAIGDPYPFGVIRQITADNVPSDVDVSFSIPDFEAPFLAAWGVD